MAAFTRKIGVVGFLLSVGVACTQLFGDPGKNTLSDERKKPPITMSTMPALPGTAGAAAAPVDAALCSAGQFQCSGALLQACADDLKSWVTIQRCAAAALCQPEPATCLAATCGADEMACAGSVLQRCNAERSGWDVFATCASPAHCNADLRQCMPEPCTPGQRRCDRSDVDQAPVLETCQEDRADWQQLDSCVTRELCDLTLNPVSAGGLTVGSDGMVQLEAPPAPEQVTSCLLPACAVGEVRCEGSLLQYCAEGRTGFVPAEECATPALCGASLSNFTSTGTPACLPPVCALNEHQCTDSGVLQVCNEDRTGFRVIQTCIGPAFCNAGLANQGQDGCRSAPCEAGQKQCNGAQIEVCRADQMGLDDDGPACESAALCNASDPANVFCEPPTCRRGATSGDEFRCEGAELQRCNQALNGYDTIDTCVSAALCDPSQRFDGCQDPVCQPEQHACSAGFLQVCNPEQTGFAELENCGSQAACDANAGRCADPCMPGSVRCNEQSGDLEECVDLLTGWTTTADCLSLPLCDAEDRRCNPPVCAAGARRCETRGQNPVVTQCASGREAFNVVRTCQQGQICDAQNNECDVCVPNAVRCEGDTLVTCDSRGQSESRQQCGDGLCSEGARRCLSCDPIGSARCSDRQLFVCSQGPQGEFEASEFCETDELCGQTLQSCGRGLGGQACQCNEGTCRPNQTRCDNGQVQRCNDGLTGFDTLANCGSQALCNAFTADCNTCLANELSCNNGQLRQCAPDGRSFARQNIGVECANATQVRVCNGAAAGVQNCPNGCTNGRGCNQCTGNGVQCVNGNTLRRCVNGFFQDQACAQGCNTGAAQCNACSGNGTSCINGNTQQQCVNGQFVNSNCPQGCVGGRCATCSGAVCNGNQIQRCTNGQLQAPTSCSDGNACNGAEFCGNGVCQPVPALNCDDGNECTSDGCNPGSGCTHANIGGSCSDGNACNGEEFCGNGICQNVPDLFCDDGNECTNDGCNPNTGCTHTNNANGCSDGDTCNGTDTCRGGFCVNDGNPLNCDDGNVCTSDSCQNGFGCTHGNLGGSCSDGNVCNGEEFCGNGICQDTPDLFCDDGDPCTADSCNAGSGCVNTRNEALCGGNGAPCTSDAQCATPRFFCNTALRACQAAIG